MVNNLRVHSEKTLGNPSITVLTCNFVKDVEFFSPLKDFIFNYQAWAWKIDLCYDVTVVGSQIRPNPTGQCLVAVCTKCLLIFVVTCT